MAEFIFDLQRFAQKLIRGTNSADNINNTIAGATILARGGDDTTTK